MITKSHRPKKTATTPAVIIQNALMNRGALRPSHLVDLFGMPAATSRRYRKHDMVPYEAVMNHLSLTRVKGGLSNVRMYLDAVLPPLPEIAGCLVPPATIPQLESDLETADERVIEFMTCLRSCARQCSPDDQRLLLLLQEFFGRPVNVWDIETPFDHLYFWPTRFETPTAVLEYFGGCGRVPVRVLHQFTTHSTPSHFLHSVRHCVDPRDNKCSLQDLRKIARTSRAWSAFHTAIQHYSATPPSPFFIPDSYLHEAAHLRLLLVHMRDGAHRLSPFCRYTLSRAGQYYDK